MDASSGAERFSTSIIMRQLWTVIGVLGASLVSAHGNHAHGPTAKQMAEPVDFRLWLHIAMEATAWGILFPLTMVLGLVRHRLHVPLSAATVALSLVGFLFGSHHGGRQFMHTVHGTFSTLLFFSLLVQAVCGIYLKLHLRWSGEHRVRPWVLGVHGILGRTYPVLGWTQAVFGIATLQRWCNGGHLGQCLAHYIMGSAFTAYSVILLIMLKCGVEWLRRRNVAQEYLDSWVILIWGIINTFTEHQGGPWTHKDLQHTLMGVVWWAGGAAGVWVSRKGKRSVIPAFIILLTGWAMSGHAQALMLSTQVHSLFGYTLMCAGICRVIEVCFVLNDRPTGEETDDIEEGQWFKIRVFQYLPPFLLVASGTLFMSATDEEMRWANSKGVDHVTWGLIDFSIAFVLFLWMNVLIDTYIGYGGRYGLTGAQSSEETPTTQTSLGSYFSLGRQMAQETMQLTPQLPSQPRSASTPRRPEPQPETQHVLFDEEDPFDDDNGPKH